MQDVGGCRAVLKTVKQVKAIREIYYNRRSDFERVGEKNYIDGPKESGYRSIHLVYKYQSGRSDSRSVYNGHHIEIQLRSQIQHSWATAVETVGTVIGAALKSSEGSEDWLSLFKYISALFAIEEGTARVPNTPSHSLLVKVAKSDVKKLQMQQTVLSEHIVDTILSTSLTLLRATFSPKGEPDALEGTVNDGREGKFHP